MPSAGSATSPYNPSSRLSVPAPPTGCNQNPESHRLRRAPSVAKKHESVLMFFREGGWRRGRDSNPRGGYKPPTRFPVAFLRPARTPLRTDDLRTHPGIKMVAEREGFEPSVRFYPYNRLAGGCLQPARPPLRTDNPRENPVSKKMPDFARALPPTSRIAPATSWHPAVAQKHEDVPMLLSEALACPAVAQKHEAFTHAFERRRVAEREGFAR